MNTPFTTTDAVIAALGGRKAVAELLGKRPQAVSNWMSAYRGKFPCQTYVIIQQALTDLNLPTAPPSLWEMQLRSPKARGR
jgi:DNA-binding transcriptional regulator YdaS (Cro superfamily)